MTALISSRGTCPTISAIYGCLPIDSIPRPRNLHIAFDAHLADVLIVCDGSIGRRFMGYRGNISIIKRAAGVMLISAGTRDGRGSAAEGKGPDGRETITQLCIPQIQSCGYRARASLPALRSRGAIPHLCT